jgi:hypothetical protein
MLPTSFRKTSQMRLIERLHHGRAIDLILEDARRQHPTTEGVAAALGVSDETVREWERRFAAACEAEGVAA